MGKNILKKSRMLFLFAIILMSSFIIAEDVSDNSNYAIINNVTIYNLSLKYAPVWQFDKEQIINIYVKSNVGYVNLDSLTVELRNNVTSVLNYANSITGMYTYKYRISEQNVSLLTFDITAKKDGIIVIKTIEIPIQKGNVSAEKIRDVLLNSFAYIKENAVEAFIIFVIFVVFVILGIIIAGSSKSKRKQYYA